MVREHAYGAIEAILFSLGEPVPASLIAKSLGLSVDDVRDLLLDMIIEKKKPCSGLQIVYYSDTDSYQLCTKKEYYRIICAAGPIQEPPEEMTPAQFETLTIIAYGQPITRAEIEKIRGVSSFEHISYLISVGLVEEKGRIEKRGRPIVFGTTTAFLQKYGLSSIDELPVLTDEDREIIEKETEDEIARQFGLFS